VLFPETYTRTWTRKFRTFFGRTLADPDRLLQGAGKFMRHVQLKPGKKPAVCGKKQTGTRDWGALARGSARRADQKNCRRRGSLARARKLGI